MSVLTASTHVKRPIEQVFQAYTELDKAVERIPSITELTVLTDGPFGEGTRWRETRLIFKKEATEEMWVTGFHPPESYTVEAESHGMKYATLFTFEPEGDGTKVTWEFTGTPQTMGAKIMSPIFNLLLKGTMKKALLSDLEGIRDACEAEG